MAKKPKGTDTDAKRGKRGKTSKPSKMAKKAGQSILGLANSDLGREILADALMAAANAAAAALVRVGARGKNQPLGFADIKEEAASAGKDFARTATGAIAGAVVDAARRLLPANEDSETRPVAAKARATKRATPRAAKTAARTPAKKPTAAKRATKASATEGGARAAKAPAAKKPAAKRTPAKSRSSAASTSPAATAAPEGGAE